MVFPREVRSASGVSRTEHKKGRLWGQKSVEGIVVGDLKKPPTIGRAIRVCARADQAAEDPVGTGLGAGGQRVKPGAPGSGTESRMARADPERPAVGPGPSIEAVRQFGNLR